MPGFTEEQSGVRAKQINTAEVLFRKGYQIFHRIFIADVTFDRHCRDLSCGSLSQFKTQIRHDYMRALSCKTLAKCLADTATGTSHHHILIS